MNTECLSESLREKIGGALQQRGTVALFPPLPPNQRTSPAQPAMFLVYVCGTWLVARFVILLLAFFGIMPNPGFPWGFLRAVQPGLNLAFMQLSLSLLLTLLVYVRFFYRYNDYLYHLNPTKAPPDFLLDCLVAISGVAIIVTAGNCVLLAASFSALFLFAGLKYLQGYWVCCASAREAIGELELSTLWTLNAVIMRKKFIYDMEWCAAFALLGLISLGIGPMTSAVILGVLIPAQLVYMYIGDPAQIALRSMNFVSPPRTVSASVLQRFYHLSRPYSLPYISLIGFCGVMSGQRLPSGGDIVLALLLGPIVWVAMLAFHDFAHMRSDQISGRVRARAHWLLVPFGLVLLFVAIALGALAGRLTATLVVGSAVLGGLDEVGRKNKSFTHSIQTS
ncbi:MAG: hypothetical protein P8123_05510 [bacterium]